VVHHRQRLPLGLEAGNHLAGVHPRLDDLQSDLAAYGLGLLGDVDDAHAPFADLLHQLVRADDRADAISRLLRDGVDRRSHCWRLEEVPGAVVDYEKRLDPGPQVLVTGTRAIEVGGALRRRVQVEGLIEDRQRAQQGGRAVHGTAPFFGL
jgi:hypothetical protein